MKKQLHPGRHRQSMNSKLSKKGTLGNESFQMLKQFQSNKSQVQKSNRNLSLSNRHKPEAQARNTFNQKQSGLIANMNIYTKYKKDKVNKHDDLTIIKKDLSREVNQIKKGYQTFMESRKEERNSLLQYSSVSTRKTEKTEKGGNRTDYCLQSLYQRRTIDCDIKNKSKDNWRLNNRKNSLLNAEKQFKKGRKNSLANLTTKTQSKTNEQFKPNSKRKDNDQKKQKQHNTKNVVYSNVVNNNNLFINNKGVINKKKIKNEISVNLNLNFNIDGISKDKNSNKDKKQKKDTQKEKNERFKNDNKKIAEPSDSKKNLIDILSMELSKEDIDIPEPEKIGDLDYYRKDILATLSNKLILGQKTDTYTNELFFDHFKSTYLDFSVLNKTNMKRMLKKAKPLTDLSFISENKKYLFLDLDETLVYCSFKKGNNEAIPFQLSNSNQTVS